ncbi:hypothetical protein C8Q75DRAFT_807217 [Abortiporus biennis]|nr:hypothetical protein C8Q75DRAFT_807217 [Abortiporus biennis]
MENDEHLIFFKRPTPIGPIRSHASFKTDRDTILKRKFLDAMKGLSFTDSKLLVKSSAGKNDEIAVVFDVLNAASDVFKEYRNTARISNTNLLDVEGRYNEDSDLEEDEVDEVCAASGDSGVKTMSVTESTQVAAGAELDDNPSNILDQASTAAVNSDFTMSDLSSEISGFSLEEDDHYDLPSSSTTAPMPFKLVPHGMVLDVKDRDHVIIPVPGASKTWKALYFFLLTDQLNFAPLRSTRKPTHEPAGSECNEDDSPPSCSAKSMYWLADTFNFVEAKRLALAAIKASLNQYNVVQELFSDFTWRYPDILQIALETYKIYLGDPQVELAMADHSALVVRRKQEHLIRVLVGIHTTLVDEFEPYRAVDQQAAMDCLNDGSGLGGQTCVSMNLNGKKKKKARR